MVSDKTPSRYPEPDAEDHRGSHEPLASKRSRYRREDNVIKEERPKGRFSFGLTDSQLSILLPSERFFISEGGTMPWRKVFLSRLRRETGRNKPGFDVVVRLETYSRNVRKYVRMATHQGRRIIVINPKNEISRILGRSQPVNAQVRKARRSIAAQHRRVALWAAGLLPIGEV